jgi:disulfide bond formation protein DsbB
MGDRRNALYWAIGWWFARRWMRRRAAAAMAGVAAGASARRNRIGAVLGALALVGVIAGAFVVWRKLAAQPKEPEPWPSSDGAPSTPVPPAPETQAPEAPPATA